MTVAHRTTGRGGVSGNLVAAVVVMLAAVVLAGCSDGNGDRRVLGSGHLVEQSRDTSDVNAVELRGRGRMTVEIGSSESLSISAEDNLLSLITSEVVDGRLIVDVDPAIDPTEQLEFQVTVMELFVVTVAGSGSVVTSGLDAGTFEISVSGSGEVDAGMLSVDRLKASISGSGHIEVEGTAGNLEVSVRGSGHFAGSGLEATAASISVSGSGMATVDVVDELEADVSGSGTIEYLGGPDLVQRVSGSGQVRRG